MKQENKVIAKATGIVCVATFFLTWLFQPLEMQVKRNTKGIAANASSVVRIDERTLIYKSYFDELADGQARIEALLMQHPAQ
jgi:hypothetical protein